MSLYKVLVAVDESEPAEWAIKVGIDVARRCGAKIGLVHVIHGAMALTPEFAMAREDLAEDAHKAAGDLLRRAMAKLPAELQGEIFLHLGEPSQQIIATARKWGADLIVLGTHGRSGIAHMLIGSTAESVVRRADCPVLTVGHDPAERALRHHVDLAEIGAHSSQQPSALRPAELHPVN